MIGIVFLVVVGHSLVGIAMPVGCAGDHDRCEQNQYNLAFKEIPKPVLSL
jgi:hypothetical protein